MSRAALARLLLCAVLALASASPALAHKLKVFAAVEGTTVSGYAFFIGGGRAQGSSWVAKDDGGTSVASGRTDAEGRFRFEVPVNLASGLTVTVDTGEAHIASATLPASRLGLTSPAADSSPPAAAAAPAAGPLDDRQTAALVDAAVQRQVEPLLERIEQMDSRLRLVDVLSGIFLIIGLAGIGLWARGRRR